MAGRESSEFDKVLGMLIEAFPYHELSIRRLIKVNEAFREVCVDFAEARAALQKSSQTVDQGGEGRRLEWEEIVERLQADISDALRTHEADLPHVRR